MTTCLLAVTLAISGIGNPSANASTCALSSKLVPSCGVLTGAFVAPRSGETAKSAFTRFEKQVGAKQRIVHTYHRGTQLFPTTWETSLANAGRTLLINWKPEAGHTWAQVAAGKSDRYINKEAAYLEEHLHQKFFLAIHHEPEDEVVARKGSGYTATDYRHMYQHVVKRIRAAGVTNAVFVMNYMGAQKWMTTSWIKNLWPGASYVDWVAYDPYVTPNTNGQSGGFNWLANTHWGDNFSGMYAWLERHHPHKPIMFAEWGVGEKPGEPSYKSNLFDSVPTLLRRYPKIKAMVYFDVPHAVPSGNVQADTTKSSLTAYRQMLDHPVFTSAP